MNHQHLFRALPLARPEGHAGLEDVRPGLTFAGAETAFTGVGEVEQRHPVIAGQHNHRLAERLLIEFDPNRQRNVEEMLLELCRQTFGLSQQSARRMINRSGRRKCTAT